MRILWLSNPPWSGSGYGQQTQLFTQRLAAAGHDVAVLCNWGLHARETTCDGIVCYPSDSVWGNRNLPVFAQAFQPDQIIALCDAWVLKPELWPDDLPPVAVWAPVDHHPLPPQVKAVLEHPNVTPIAMSRFGVTQMRDAGLDPVYIPHGIDTSLFRPMREHKQTIRQQLQLPADAFVVGMVAANLAAPHLPRKGFPQAFLAFAEFAKTHPDAWLYVHTDFNPMGVGMDLNIVADLAQLPAGRVRYPDGNSVQIGLPPEVVAYTYQAFDVLLNPSMGEGFGIPIVEAQACGVPVICSRHSAMTELTEAGWLVDGDPWLDYAQLSWFHSPSVGAIVSALEAAYQARHDRGLRRQARAFAAAYDADTVFQTHWQPALQQLQPVAVAA